MHSPGSRLSVGIALLISSFSALAQILTYDVYLDTDNSSATGCSVTAVGGNTVDGVEQRASAIVDSSTLMVTGVSLATCSGTVFGGGTPVGGGIPVGLNNGISGSDVIEFNIPRSGLIGSVGLRALASNASGSDLLATTNGSAGSAGISFSISSGTDGITAIPALNGIGLLVLAAGFLVGGLVYVRIGRHWLFLSLIALSGVVIAANFVSDGQVGDWSGNSPQATDPTGDPTNGESGIDLVAFFIAQEGNNLFFRLDVVDLENQAPVAVDDAFNVSEDNPLSQTAPGVLANDSDSDMDPITATLATGPSNAQSFTLNPDGSFDYTPAANFTGVDSFTYVANDGSADSSPATVTITVDPVNDAPSFVLASNPSVLEDAGAQNLTGFASSISAGPPDENAQVLTFIIVANDNPGLFSAGPTIAANGDLSFTPAADANGTANVTVELMDNGGTANGGVDTSATQTFAINVTAVNDAPSFTGGGDVNANEDAGPQTLPWASAISAGPANEAGQVLSFNITGNSNPGLFVAGPTISASGDLSFTSAPNAFGNALITLVLADNGGTANGGVDTSPVQSFTIAIAPVNDPPVVLPPGPFNVSGNVRIQVPDGPNDLLAGASDPIDGAGALPFFIGGTVPTASVQGGNLNINVVDGSFSYDPPPGYEGPDSFSYEVCDSGVPGSACTLATVNLSVSDMIWFIAAGGPAGDGRLTSPFNDVDAFNSVNDGAGNHPAAGDDIFLFSGAHDGSIALLGGQRIFGQGASATLAAMTGITLPTFSDPLPATGGIAPTWTVGNATALTLGTNNTLRGFVIGDTGSGVDIAGNSFGTLSVSEMSLGGTGQALNLAGGTLSNGAGAPGFASITSTSGTRNISLTNVNGTPTFNGGALSGASNQAFFVNGGNGTFSYAGTINNATSRVAEIQNKSGGTISLSGSVTGTASGILINANSNTTINFTNTVDITNTPSAALTISNNSGGSTTFADLDINNATSNQAGLVATANNDTHTLNITTGTINAGNNRAVDIDNTVLGVNLVRVDSVGGTVPGIDIDSTSGFFTVAGAGGDCQNNVAQCSGGTIANKSGAGDGTDGVLLTDASNVTLNRMNLNNNNRNGLFATRVNGLVLNQLRVTNNADNVTPDEAGIYLVDVTGSAQAGANPTTFTNIRVGNSFEHNVIVRHQSGTLSDLAVNNSIFENNGGSTQAGNNFFVDTGGTANVTVNVTSSAFNGSTTAGMLTAFGFVGDAADTSTLSVNVSQSSFDKNNVGLSASVSNGADVFFDFSNNPSITGHISNAINLFANASHTGTFSGTVGGNTIGTQGTPGSGSVSGSGIRLANEGGGSAVVLIDGNTVREIQNFEGIFIDKSVTAGATDVTVSNNTISDTDFDRGLVIQNRIAGGTTCADVNGNSFSNIGGLEDLRVRQTNGTFNIVQTSAANLSTVNNGATVSTAGTLNFNAAACATP
ncbi:MAG: beta strand repeat-containing protein [Gammaproteobacteria bacterium]